MNVERLLPHADKALNDADILVNDGKVPEKYLGYVAAFGATVINMGIESALLYYMKDKQKYLDDKQNSEEDPIKYKGNINKVYRVKVVKALTYILENSEELKNCSEEKIDDLKKWVENENSTLEQYHKTQKIVDASVALKLMIRTYPIQKNNDEQQENAQ